ncbi:Os11g0459500 [Oryza sativa Japonica Group]|uniref:Os11g0459500 protein n=2 Tax=Oryza sativa subsp. japonica TaxID=39947 RepID=Q0ISU6_ORYSJ|nr:hypothetical protein LOC_Os11g27120 [Oryza sativa Japonica Group]BAF28219.1 Os11g0459500 [Oryza sativa Japonica Group]|eukprot:NP_001067856.1 Os11g0459500 [Oryza sativa Japonica Group]
MQVLPVLFHSPMVGSLLLLLSHGERESKDGARELLATHHAEKFTREGKKATAQYPDQD